MAHSFVQLNIHIIFSTKQRCPFLTEQIRPRLLSYLGTLLRSLDAPPTIINGAADHLHLLTSIPATRSIADIVRDMKAISSGWIHREFPLLSKFAWQTGYAAFSVSATDVDSVREYIRSQERHHRRVSFQEEYLRLLHEAGIAIDDRFLWE